MSPPLVLPPNLQTRILGYIEGEYFIIKDRTTTLATCCLVCQAWLRICQKALMMTITLRSLTHLKSLVAMLPSTTHPIGTYVIELSLASDEDKPFHHIVPLYLASKLISLQQLNLQGKGGGSAFVVHPSSVMHFTRFRAVTTLKLFHMTFQSFWNFRRFLASLPALSDLHIDRVELSNTHPFL